MVCNINYNPWHSPNSHRPLLPIIRDSVGARRSPASALLRRPIGDVPPLEQPGLSDFTDVKQPKYRVLWELNGSSMGVQWEIEGRFMVFNGTFHPLQWSYETNHLSILWGEHEDMMEYHGSHEWYVQQHLRMSFFLVVFFIVPHSSRYGHHCSTCSPHDEKSGFFTQPSILSILRVLTLDHPKKMMSRGVLEKIGSGRSGRSGRSRLSELMNIAGLWASMFVFKRVNSWHGKSDSSTPVCSEKPWFWKWLWPI